MSKQVYMNEGGREFTTTPIIFEGDYEIAPDMGYAELRAKKLAEAGRRVTIINVLREPNGDIVGLTYEAIISVNVSEPRALDE